MLFKKRICKKKQTSIVRLPNYYTEEYSMYDNMFQVQSKQNK